MMANHLSAVFLILAAALSAPAQERNGPADKPAATSGAAAIPEGKPASTNVPGQPFPRIHDDLRATFRIKASGAQKVILSIGKEYPMQDAGDGAWTVTTDPLVPGFHYYWLIVDGANVSDPASETFYGWNRQSSGIEVPTPGEDFFPAERRPAWRSARAHLLLENHAELAPHLRLHPA